MTRTYPSPRTTPDLRPMSMRDAAERLADCEQNILRLRAVQVQYDRDHMYDAAECAEERINILLAIWQRLRALIL